MNVILTQAAKRDVAQAFEWYEAKREGLAMEFLDRVDEAMTVISKNPMAFRKRIGEVRRMQLDQFPYGIWYRIEENAIVIACLHAKRDERLARERAKGIIPLEPY